MSDQPPTKLEAWEHLGTLANRLVKQPLADLLDTPDRFGTSSYRLGPLLVDFSRQRVDPEVMRTLAALGEELDLAAGFRALMAGQTVNTTESRPALHTALRAPTDQQPAAFREAITSTREQMARFVAKVRGGHWRGHTGRPVRDVVHVGIGGSHLGPELITDALSGSLNVHFLANIDGHAFKRTLKPLNAETTLFIIASKSFSTLETRVNAESARAWCVERGCARDELAKHFVAVTANVDAAREFGIEGDHIFPMWDWVGGRYSLWSAVGLPIALAAGMPAFENLLAGAHEVDRHALTTPLARNVPALMALIGIWNYNFLGAQTHAVLPYDHRLRHLPAYLQQLEMESNGKSVQRDGQPSPIQTMPVLWGGEETNGQHAFHQLLLQGTRAFSADLVACAVPDHSLPDHHQWLLANWLAQSEALARGKNDDDPHRAVPGNRATSLIVLDSLSPRALGALIALYEHKVYCQSMIWNINAFDQWGVEFGKALGVRVHSALADGGANLRETAARALIKWLKKL